MHITKIADKSIIAFLLYNSRVQTLESSTKFRSTNFGKHMFMHSYLNIQFVFAFMFLRVCVKKEYL